MQQKHCNRYRHGLLAFILLWVFFPLTAGAAAAKITAVHVTTQQRLTRFIFEVSDPVHYHFSSANQRLLLTVADVELTCPLPKTSLAKTPVEDYQAKGEPGEVLQFTFNLKQPVTARAYTLAPSGTYGQRLVLDLKPVSGGVATAQPQPQSANAETVTVGSQSKRKIAAAKVSAARSLIVVIDPGHGGKDPGATGVAGNKEKNVVLAIAKVLSKELSRQSGVRVYLTRTRDEFISLRQRLAIARRYKADLFIAVHADAAYQNTTANGASVFALSGRGATSEMARWLAEKENQSELVDGVFVNRDQVLRSVLLDLSQTHTISVSLEMGQAILNQLGLITDLHYTQVEQAAFVVLKSPDIPSLLVETGYLSNPQQEKQLLNPAYQQRIANAIAEGVKAYFASRPPQAV